jgi:hypothetical protein
MSDFDYADDVEPEVVLDPEEPIVDILDEDDVVVLDEDEGIEFDDTELIDGAVPEDDDYDDEAGATRL